MNKALYLHPFERTRPPKMKRACLLKFPSLFTWANEAGTLERDIHAVRLKSSVLLFADDCLPPADKADGSYTFPPARIPTGRESRYLVLYTTLTRSVVTG